MRLWNIVGWIWFSLSAGFLVVAWWTTRTTAAPSSRIGAGTSRHAPLPLDPSKEEPPRWPPGLS